LTEDRSPVQDRENVFEVRKAVRLADALQRARSTSFDQCAATYIDTHRGGWKNASHADQSKDVLATDASPIIGMLPVTDVDTDLVVKMLSSMALKALRLKHAFAKGNYQKLTLEAAASSIVPQRFTNAIIECVCRVSPLPARLHL
jgi:hypothetical protein